MKIIRFLSLPVMAVISLMAFVYYSTMFILIDDWVGLQSSPGILNASFFTVLASFCLLSFLVCVLTDPGQVPSSYLPDVEGREITGHANGKDCLEQKRCDKCFTYKPPRTHHCRVCRRCILKMDHHCMWINNCVGYWNYKAFFLLTLYATISSIHSTAIFISFVLQKDWDSLKGRSLKIYHYYEGKRAQWLARKSGQSYRHSFNIGAYKNITLILGPNMLKWLCPTAVSHLRDGTSFPTSRDSS